ncbi:hypothetical protein [Burkholderia pseudomallei]|uniref:hypothetical protein n=1 Tax=Burkholderia pseudomallei TaxID=28450 RepID=UPI0005C9B87C|nr:hypothetical protein [Burkholderia pseudomallei]KIX68829.1 hypothetical protein SZ30_08100 [Burkholderia pseudomallei]
MSDISIEGKTTQLSALLTSMYGEGFVTFKRLYDHDQEALIWLAADLVDEIKSAVAEVRHG